MHGPAHVSGKSLDGPAVRDSSNSEILLRCNGKHHLAGDQASCAKQIEVRPGLRCAASGLPAT